MPLALVPILEATSQDGSLSAHDNDGAKVLVDLSDQQDLSSPPLSALDQLADSYPPEGDHGTANGGDEPSDAVQRPIKPPILPFQDQQGGIDRQNHDGNATAYMSPSGSLVVLFEIPVGDDLKRPEDTPGKPLKEAMCEENVSV